ncbi:hypothetical protein HRbin02_01771 [Candidatus Calditenuaceae archaeon HR02]|nr:hypothetical protein HRbin02_01771 [Candidatus Calditenuaceae archaeon HR02]
MLRGEKAPEEAVNDYLSVVESKLKKKIDIKKILAEQYVERPGLH